MYNAVRLLFFLLARSSQNPPYHIIGGFECVLGIYSMENVKQHAWIYGSSQQLSNNITCYRKERKQNILPRSFRCVIFFALFILLCCCSNLLWLLLLLSMVRLWQRNVHRLYHIILFFFAQRKRERESAWKERPNAKYVNIYIIGWFDIRFDNSSAFLPFDVFGWNVQRQAKTALCISALYPTRCCCTFSRKFFAQHTQV